MISANAYFNSYFIPAAVPSKRLMIVLHGKGDSWHPFKDFNEELELENINFLLLNAPKKFMGGYSWYGEPPYQREGVLKIREKMFDLLNDLLAQGWLAKDIFLFGFSQGCLVSTDVALHYSEKLAGVVGVSGYFNFEPRWRKGISAKAAKTPWLLLHGHNDRVLPLADTKFGVKKLREIGLKIDWVESDKAHTFENEDYDVIRDWVRNS